MGESKQGMGKPLPTLANLLDSRALSAPRSNIPAQSPEFREQVKHLLHDSPKEIPPTPREHDPVSRAHALLVQDFLSRQMELCKLNRARKQQIEAYLAHKGEKLAIDQLTARHKPSKSMQSFAEECCGLYLMQLGLLQSWAMLSEDADSDICSLTRTLNWKITNYLKKGSQKQIIAAHEWLFLKTNIFSWYSPTADTFTKVSQLLASSKDQLSQQLLSLPFVAQHSMDKLDQECGQFMAMLTSVPGRKVLLCGTGIAGILPILLKHSAPDTQLWIRTRSEFETYLAEIISLLVSVPNIPKVYVDLATEPNLEDLNVIFHLSPKESTPEGFVSEVLYLSRRLTPKGKLLTSSHSFWPTELSDHYRELRESITKQNSVLSILDCRQMINASGPRCWAFFEKTSSKEQRDMGRPLLLRARGDGNNAVGLAATIAHSWQHPPLIGEMDAHVCAGGGLRLETMLSTCPQGQLKGAPWTMLSNQDFFHAAQLLKRAPARIFNQGSIVPNQSQLMSSADNCLHIIELPGSAILATNNLAGQELPNNARLYLFALDKGIQESQNFFSAWMNCSLNQFWYRLETDASIVKTKTAEKLIKMIPLVRMALGQRDKPPLALNNLEDIKSSLPTLRGPRENMLRSWLVHDWIVSTDALLCKSIQSLKDFSKHLLPELSLQRWSLPSTLPPIDNSSVFQALAHLPQAPILQHPGLAIAARKDRDDFRIVNIELRRLGPVSELAISGDTDQCLTVSGATLFIQFIHKQLQQSAGKNSLQSLRAIKLPLDTKLVISQYEQFQDIVQRQLNTIQQLAELLDLVFCELIGIEAENCSAHLQMLKQQLGTSSQEPARLFPHSDLATSISFVSTKENQR